MLKLKINFDTMGFKAGDIIEIDSDADGVPMKREWRNRLADAAIDNCVEIVRDADSIEKVSQKKK